MVGLVADRKRYLVAFYLFHSTQSTAAIGPCVGEYATGVDLASDSKVPHLAHIAASAIILMDGEAAGTLIDDRFKIAGYEDVLRQVAALKATWIAAKAT